MNATSAQVTQSIRHYRIEAKLGDGGMGAVYRAVDSRLNRPVALKLMHDSLGSRADFRERFLQEAQAAARLNHPHIATVYDMDADQGRLYIAMEFIRGGTLGGYVRRLEEAGQVLQLAEVLFLTAQVADALDYAHRQGVVHRDIKPDNVMIEPIDEPARDGEPPLRAVVTDFGLAKLLDGGTNTATGTFMGTMPYMSPEQCLGRNLDGRSDIYSLGVMLFQLVTGRLPFAITSPVDALQKHLRTPPPDLSQLRPDLPPAVATIIQRALAKKAADRYPLARDMAAALRAAAAPLPANDPTMLNGGGATIPAVSLTTMATRLHSGAPLPLPTNVGHDLTRLGVAGDELLISRPGQPPRRVQLDRQTMIVGRSSRSHLVLDDSAVSGTHAALVRAGDGSWEIVDKGSTNGTYVAGSKLLPHIPEPLAPGQTVRIGAFYLQLDGGQPAGTQVQALSHARPPRATAVGQHGSVIRTRLGSIMLDPATVTVEAGGGADVALRIMNEWRRVVNLTVEIEGLPADWVTLSQPRAALMPGDEALLSFRLHPPRSSQAAARSYPYQILLLDEQGNEVTSMGGALTVTPFHAFTLDLHPQQLRRPGVSRLIIRNQGNAPAGYTITAGSESDAIQFDPQQQRVEVAPGAEVEVPVRLNARRPLLGTPQQTPWSAAVKPAAGQPQQVAGQLQLTPRLPLWTLSLLLMGMMMLCAGGVFGVNFWRQDQAEKEAAAVAQANAAATAVAEMTRAAEAAATAQAFAAATATAQAVAASDDDGDGLSNEAELARGLNPNLADTDQDGLSDGEEVNLHGTNPQKQDSDADGLKDGDEVAAKTFPNNQDSDNDGLLDGLDPEPLIPATPTPDADATAVVEEAQSAADATATAEAQAAAEATAQAQAAAEATAQAQAAAEATAQAAQAALDAQFAELVGSWVNVDAGTRGMTRLEIQRDGDDAVTFHGFGACSPSDCDWGLTAAPFTPPALTGVYDFGFKTSTITVQRNGDLLDVEIYDDYAPGDSRQDTTRSYVMERLEARQEALDALSGDWRNVDGNTGGMTRLIIAAVDAETVSAHGFGACSPSDCDWGVVTATYGDPLVIIYTFSFKTTTITAQLVGDQLHVTTLDEYNDGRADRVSNYVMGR